MERLLVVCTANQCRSPVGGAILQHFAGQRRREVEVRSAGFIEGGVAPPSEIVELGSTFGLELAEHRSQQVTAELVEGSSLVVGMTRRHVRELAIAYPGSWPRAFTIRELVRRGREVGGLGPDGELAAWIVAMHEGRQTADLLGADETDEVADPMGGSWEDFEEMGRTLWGLAHGLADLIWPAR